MSEVSTSATATSATGRIVLIDDHAFVLEGIKQRFEEAPDLVIVAVATSVAAGLDAVVSERPDVAVVDYRLPDGDGIELVRRIQEQCPDTKCVIYTSVNFASDVIHGADAIVIKELFEDKLIETIRDLRLANRASHDLRP